MPPLQPLGPPPELVFSIGGAETKVTFGENGQVRFDDLSHLAKLTAEDYVTLRLYQNSDAGNILWEWQTAPIYLEKFDSEYPDVELAWDTYYPGLGDKLITVRSELSAEDLEGRQVRAELLSAPGEPGQAGLLVNGKPEKTAMATFFQQGGQYKAQFKLSGRNLAPDAASNNEDIKVRFTLLSADGASDEASIEQDWRVKNNSNTTLDEVLKGEGVFVYDSDTTAFKQDDHIGVSDGQVRKFDYVQGLLNQVIPRKRSVTPAMYGYIEEGGIYYKGTESAIALFKQHFNIDNTSFLGGKNSFNKLMKDYDQQAASQKATWTNNIVDKELLVGVQQRTTDVAVNQTVNSGDVGLYELYDNVVRPFVDSMIAEADKFRTQATSNWISRKDYGASIHGSAMSYCFGCKDTLAEFNGQVVNCKAEAADEIIARENDDPTPKENYRGNVGSTEGETPQTCAVGGTNPDEPDRGQWAGLLYDEWKYWHDSAPLKAPAAFNPKLWAGIDCSGLMQRALDGARPGALAHGASITVPQLVNVDTDPRTAQGLMTTTSYVYRTPTTPSGKEVEFLRRGDWVGYKSKKTGRITHISMVYSDKPDADGNYQIIHAFGPSDDVYDDDGDPLTDPIFGRMVIVTKHSVKAASDYGRIRLWK